jgi:hypothetical protein
MCSTEDKKTRAESILTRTLQRAAKEGIAGTPTIINEAGERSAGALTPEALETFVQKGFEAANKSSDAKAPSIKAPEPASRDSKETKPQGAE